MYLTPTLLVDKYALDIGLDFFITAVQEGQTVAVPSYEVARQVLHALGLSEEEIDVREAIARHGTVAVATGAS